MRAIGAMLFVLVGCHAATHGELPERPYSAPPRAVPVSAEIRGEQPTFTCGKGYELVSLARWHCEALQ